MTYFGMDPDFLKFLGVGIFMGIVVTLDGYARGSIISPKDEDGEIIKGRTLAAYISIIIFCSMAAVTMGTIAVELKLGGNIAFILSGLGGLLGRDLIYVLSQKLMKRVEDIKLDDAMEFYQVDSENTKRFRKKVRRNSEPKYNKRFDDMYIYIEDYYEDGNQKRSGSNNEECSDQTKNNNDVKNETSEGK